MRGAKMVIDDGDHRSGTNVALGDHLRWTVHPVHGFSVLSSSHTR